MPKIKLNAERLFAADVTVVLPTEDKAKDEKQVLDVVFRIPEKGKVHMVTNIVKDVKNLEDLFEIDPDETREDVLKDLLAHPCYMPAFIKTFEDKTSGKNTR